MPGDGSLVADAEQGRARPRGSSVSPESPPPKVLTLYYKESVKGFLFTSVGFSHAFIHII